MSWFYLLEARRPPASTSVLLIILTAQARRRPPPLPHLHTHRPTSTQAGPHPSTREAARVPLAHSARRRRGHEERARELLQAVLAGAQAGPQTGAEAAEGAAEAMTSTDGETES